MSDIEVREPHDPREHQAAAGLMTEVWGQPLAEPGLLTALAHSGNYVACAYRDGALVGVALGFRTADNALHSHATAIRSDLRGRGVGRLLKFHQRDWALSRGIEAIVWTYDPLVRRNAHFNLHVLGARVEEYLPDFYGAMRDRLNGGAPSDRLLVRWALDAPIPPVPETRTAEALGARVLLEPGAEHPTDEPYEGRLLVAVPADIEVMREASRRAALRARYAVRAALAPALAAGMRITGITRDGYYLLEETR
ncbi:GNAT family N-acetyltransferase [Actinocorallia sp. API 0066]|uniref:GNAT family N-acetyltransferase n=1 Tax=Actinocorallia sp. API 0066 TaxID=2896846 RepID=UPI001E4E0D83|nr:GNAT family N-acetyltransferase [Actinocorallia sp. API 0066]MCD0451466.1 GNAT family N-acetyltransferase [Actinocorallia sp. API 0066]